MKAVIRSVDLQILYSPQEGFRDGDGIKTVMATGQYTEKELTEVSITQEQWYINKITTEYFRPKKP